MTVNAAKTRDTILPEIADRDAGTPDSGAGLDTGAGREVDVEVGAGMGAGEVFGAGVGVETSTDCGATIDAAATAADPSGNATSVSRAIILDRVGSRDTAGALVASILTPLPVARGAAAGETAMAACAGSLGTSGENNLAASTATGAGVAPFGELAEVTVASPARGWGDGTATAAPTGGGVSVVTSAATGVSTGVTVESTTAIGTLVGVSEAGPNRGRVAPPATVKTGLHGTADVMPIGFATVGTGKLWFEPGTGSTVSFASSTVSAGISEDTFDGRTTAGWAKKIPARAASAVAAAGFPAGSADAEKSGSICANVPAPGLAAVPRAVVGVSPEARKEEKLASAEAGQEGSCMS